MTTDIHNKRIILSRTDSIGDVVLTLPMAGVLKSLFPGCRIIFLGSTYTKPVVDVCKHVDEFLDWQSVKEFPEKEQTSILKKVDADLIIHVFPVKEIAKLAKKAGIPLRVGTTNRVYHWPYCNHLTRLSRKNSPHHEAQLNLKLLTAFGAKELYSIKEIPAFYGFSSVTPLHKRYVDLLDPGRFNLILHPKSKGSSKEWGIKNFEKLIGMLPHDKFRFFLTGTRAEGDQTVSLVVKYPFITDLSGQMTLPELISFISHADGLLAASTGPLHIAAAAGKFALGLYPSMKPLHPGRWAPLGIHASFLCEDGHNTTRQEILEIEPEMVRDRLLEMLSLVL